MTQKQLTETHNKVVIAGVLAEKDLTEGKDKSGVPFIRGRFTVRTSEQETHTVNVYESKTFKSGKDNTAYTNLKSLLEDKISIADVAEGKGEEPTKVYVNTATLGLNEYANTNKKEVSRFPEIRARYVQTLQPDAKGNLKEFGAKFQVDGVIEKIQFFAANSEEQEHEAKLTLLSVDFLGNVTPLEFVLKGSNAEFVSGQWGKGTVVSLHGVLRNVFIEEKKEVTMKGGFGESTVEVTRKSVREWLVLGGKPVQEGTYNLDDKELVAEAIEKRNNWLEELELRAKSGGNNSGGATASAMKQAEKETEDLLGDLFG